MANVVHQTAVAMSNAAFWHTCNAMSLSLFDLLGSVFSIPDKLHLHRVEMGIGASRDLHTVA